MLFFDAPTLVTKGIIIVKCGADFIDFQISMKVNGVVEGSLKGIIRGEGEGLLKEEKIRRTGILTVIIATKTIRMVV